ncbi:HAMP domain-containing sensor histidine kinase [Polyangium spumosum]|uniref:histidine kinase n=1 Tax=Polyangium spumosum TaxID=889282 RepID=A0A6N7PQU1_9BACT|nr:sensor histidine kinase [Polyangium spumosum]
MRRFSLRRFRGSLPLLPVAPVLVLVIGIATAFAIALLGITQLRRISDDASSLRAAAIAGTLAARMRVATVEERPEIVGRAARRSGTELLLVEQGGQILVDESFGPPNKAEVQRLLAAGSGETRTALGRVRFAARPLDPPLDGITVLAFVSAPSPPPGYVPLVNAVAALTVLLLGVAVSVAVAFTKQLRDDVDYVRERIVDMARPDAAPTGEPIPLRSLDQVGVLTAAFNLLVTRFAAAERSYRADLQQASEMDKERSAFLAGLSHELRTPLNAILGFAHVLESEVDGPLSDEARESLAVIRTSGEHLRQLIDDILELSALETGTLQLSRGPVDVRQIAEQVVREATATIKRKPLRLEVTGESRLYAYADKRRVRQIITNLVSNAVKFTAHGSVTVQIEARGSFVKIEVRDTGPGIPREQTAAIFEEYRQLGDAQSRRRGTGLGLAITKRLVQMHGGTIDVSSEMGRGSTFTATLPHLADPGTIVESSSDSRVIDLSSDPPPRPARLLDSMTPPPMPLPRRERDR